MAVFDPNHQRRGNSVPKSAFCGERGNRAMGKESRASKPYPKDWDRVGVELPTSVLRIIEATQVADDPARGGMPYAMASIVGALPWIAVAVHGAVTPAQYREFAAQMKAELQGAWGIIGAEDPKQAFDEAFARAKKQVQ